MGTGKNPRSDAARNRVLILDAAVPLLAESPDPTLAEIANRAGIGRATVYRHFPTIGDLIDAVRDEAAQIGMRLVETHLAPVLNGDLPDMSVSTLIEQVMFLGLGTDSRLRRAAAIDPAVNHDLVEVFVPVAEAIIRRGQATGEFDPAGDPTLLGRALAVFGCGIALAHRTSGLPVEDAAAMMRVFVRGLEAAELNRPEAARPEASSATVGIAEAQG